MTVRCRWARYMEKFSCIKCLSHRPKPKTQTIPSLRQCLQTYPVISHGYSAHLISVTYMHCLEIARQSIFRVICIFWNLLVFYSLLSVVVWQVTIFCCKIVFDHFHIWFFLSLPILISSWSLIDNIWMSDSQEEEEDGSNTWPTESH